VTDEESSHPTESKSAQNRWAQTLKRFRAERNPLRQFLPTGSKSVAGLGNPQGSIIQYSARSAAV
jgi:hypothetical protein